MREALNLGAEIAVPVAGADKPIIGSVLLSRIFGERQFLTINTVYGNMTMVINLADGTPTIIVPPIDRATAREIAFKVLAGDDRRMPVTISANLLAAAVMTLTGGVA